MHVYGSLTGHRHDRLEYVWGDLCLILPDTIEWNQYVHCTNKVFVKYTSYNHDQFNTYYVLGHNDMAVWANINTVKNVQSRIVFGRLPSLLFNNFEYHGFEWSIQWKCLAQMMINNYEIVHYRYSIDL